MRGGDVIHSSPARIVLAAAAQLHDPDLTERYREEWLANLRGRTHPQRWRDALSLLLRGASATRWAYHTTSRVVVASQTTMALIVAIGMVLLFTATPSLKIPLWVFTAGHHLIVSRYYPPILFISLTAAGAIVLALLTIRSWRTALVWFLIGFFTIRYLVRTIPYNMYYIDPQGGHFQYLLAHAAGIGFANTEDWWAVTASY